MIKETKDGILFSIKISPNASKNEIIKTDDGLKVKITAQPIDGKANKALIEFLSKQLKIAKSNFDIVKGQTSKEKTVLLKTFDKEIIEKLRNFAN